MKVNGIDIKKYNGKQLTVEFKIANRIINKEWNAQQKVPQEFETSVDFSTCTVVVYFKGSDRNDAIRKIAQFTSLFDGSVDLELDHYKGKYKGFLVSSGITATKELRKKKLTLEFDGYMYDDEIKVYVNGTTPEPIELVGSREAPCTVEITAYKDIANLTIKGFGMDDIVISELKKDTTITIDGEIGIATIDGMNAFDKVDLWEFPYIKKKSLISLSNDNARMIVRYNPMWV